MKKYNTLTYIKISWCVSFWEMIFIQDVLILDMNWCIIIRLGEYIENCKYKL